jgi:sterol desaturase/sphingolipid hydroxylase (fatty acid hydroxylase superfamily)
MGKLTFTLAIFVTLLAATALARRFMPSRRGRPILTPGLRLDAAYWILMPTLTAWATRGAIALLLAVVTLLFVGSSGMSWSGHGPLARLPAWQASVAALVCADFAYYWTHRLMHRSRLWPIHAVHHSSTHVDWHSALRIHPLDRILMGISTASFLLLLGFPLQSMALAAPVAGMIGILVHLDTNIDLGWLRCLIATPAFHRWHHADEDAAHGKNLAGVFPAWDLLFGTFYMPTGAATRRFGAGEPMPDTLAGQMMHPFARTTTRGLLPFERGDGDHRSTICTGQHVQGQP